MFILSQILGVVAIITAIISVQLKEKHKLLFLQIIENTAKIFALAFVGGISGAYSETVGLLRKMWFFNTSKKKKTNELWSLMLFSSLAMLVAMITWEGYISLLPMLAVILGTVGLWQENIFILRYLALVASIFYFAYAFIVGAYTNAISEVFMIVSIIISLIRFNSRKKELLNVVHHKIDCE